MARISYRNCPEIDGIPGSAFANMAIPEAEDYLAQIGFWEYVKNKPVPLDQVVVELPFGIDGTQTGDGYKKLGLALAKAILKAAKQQISGWDLGQQSDEPNLEQGNLAEIPTHLADIDWTQVQNVRKSGAGATGVYFLEMRDGGETVVVKASDDLSTEVFGALLARELGLDTPDIIAVPNPGKEKMVVIKDKGAGKAIADKLEAMDHFVAMSCVDGFNLDEINDPDQFNKVFGPENREQHLEQIGTLAALDLWMNYSDRFPLSKYSTAGDGNPGNIMFSQEDGHVIAIDSIYGINNPQSKKTADANMWDVASEIQGDPSYPCGLVERICGMISESTGWTPDDEAKIAMQRGLLDGFRKIVALNEKRLSQLKGQVGDDSVRKMDEINVDDLLYVMKNLTSVQL